MKVQNGMVYMSAEEMNNLSAVFKGIPTIDVLENGMVLVNGKLTYPLDHLANVAALGLAYFAPPGSAEQNVVETTAEETAEQKIQKLTEELKATKEKLNTIKDLYIACCTRNVLITDLAILNTLDCIPEDYYGNLLNRAIDTMSDKKFLRIVEDLYETITEDAWDKFYESLPMSKKILTLKKIPHAFSGKYINECAKILVSEQICIFDPLNEFIVNNCHKLSDKMLIRIVGKFGTSTSAKLIEQIVERKLYPKHLLEVIKQFIFVANTDYLVCFTASQ